MLVSTKQIIKKLPKNIRLLSVIEEAIANSIDANATKITIYFKTIDKALIEGGNLNVKSVAIVDDGDGFTDENIASFNQYMSNYKQALGCKGIGRFTYLTICDKVEFLSYNNNHHITFDFTVDTDTIVPKEHNNDSGKKETVVTFNNIINKQVSSNLEEEAKEITRHFLSTFKFRTDEGKNVSIDLFLNETLFHTINSFEYGADFVDDSFDIKINDKIKENFIVSYKRQGASIKGFYCANKRSVKEDGLGISFRTKNDSGLLFFVSSKFFDNNVNDERMDFNIKESDKNLLSLDWNTINKHLFSKIDTICKKIGIDIEEISNKNKKDSIKAAPYLVSYIQKSKNMATSATIIKEAKELFELDKNYIRDTRNRQNPDYEEKLHISNHTELAEYFFDREKIISSIKNDINNISKKANETIIHDKIMKRKTSSDEHTEYKQNNLWLFDERFMAYTYAYSDKTINDILGLNDIDKKTRPDICIFAKSKNNTKDIILIELKGSDATGEKNASGINELNKYAMKIKKYFEKNKEEILIWSYLITTLNNETRQEIEVMSGVKKTYTTKGEMYYQYNEKLNMVTHVLTLDTMVEDALARNKLFLDILKGNIK